MSGTPEPLAPGNPRLKHLRRLRGRRSARRDSGQCVVEGPTLVAEVLAAATDGAGGITVVEVYADAAWLETRGGTWDSGPVPLRPVRPGVLAGVLDTVTPQPVAALVTVPSHDLSVLAAGRGARDAPVLALDAVADPGNLGTLVRSAAGAGAAGVVVGEGSADPWGPKALRASAGASLRLAVVEAPLAQALATLADGGRQILVADAHEGPPPDAVDLSGPTVLVLGNESHGVAPEVARMAQGRVAIPLAGGTESLNVAMAGTVLVFEAARQRRTGARGGTDGRPAETNA